MDPFKAVMISGPNTTSTAQHDRVLNRRVAGTHATVRLLIPQQYILARAIAAALAIGNSQCVSLRTWGICRAPEH
jgi:hypothetical protein